jgi:hypothetical protein
MMTDEQLAEWQRLADAATPGPWRYRGIYVGTDAGLVASAELPLHAAFIAASRTAVPALIEEVERLRDEIVTKELQRLNWEEAAGWRERERDEARVEVERLRKLLEERDADR